MNTIPHSFVSKIKKMSIVDVPDADKTEPIKLEFFMDTGNSA
jgi:hypothetical protein